MRYLVTGGAGFIGSHLVATLIDGGHEVIVLDDLSTGKRENLPAGVEMVEGSIVDPVVVERAMVGVDGCYHLAAVASVERATADWSGVHKVNLTGAINVFEAAIRNPRRPKVVYASSAAVYGAAETMPITERTPRKPLSAYGADKLGCELHAEAGWVVHGLQAVGVRFFNIYGPRQDPRSPYTGVIAKFMELARTGASLTVNGDGLQTRDFVYVVDAVAALMAGMARAEPAHAVFNVCTGNVTTVRDLAQHILALCGREDPVSYGPGRPGDIRFSQGDPGYATAELGFTATVPIREGLRLLAAARD